MVPTSHWPLWWGWDLELALINKVLGSLGLEPVDSDDLAPVVAA